MSSQTTDLRLLVVASDPLARTGLALALNDQPERSVVGQVAGGADLVNDIEVYRPDVVVWDLGWDPTSALEELAGLEESGPPVMALLPDNAHVSVAFAAGAMGLLLRSTDAVTIAVAIAAVARGNVVLDRGFTTAVLPMREQTETPLVESFTPREMEVLRLLAEGLPNKGIASRLGISDHTVKFHVNAILGKLGAQSRTEAVTRATRLGLILL